MQDSDPFIFENAILSRDIKRSCSNCGNLNCRDVQMKTCDLAEACCEEWEQKKVRLVFWLVMADKVDSISTN